MPNSNLGARNVNSKHYVKIIQNSCGDFVLDEAATACGNT